jgi:diguanylate cyclase (GGDEF)-like protein/PAS domain S-box-containing protein
MSSTRAPGRDCSDYLNAIPAALILMDGGGRITFVNAHAEQSLVWQHGSAVGRHIDELLPDCFPAGGGGDPSSSASFRGHCRRGDGTRVEVEAFRGRLGGNDGEQTLVLLHDISLPTRTEQALEESRAQLAKAERLARLGSWRWEPVASRVIWSEELYRILGLQPRQATPSLETFLRHVHPEDQTRVRTALDKTQKTKKSFRFHHRIIRPNGVERIVHSRGQWSASTGDTPVLIGTVQDVTTSKLTEAALREQSARNKLILRTSPDGFWVSGLDGALQEVNDAYCKMVGYSRGELLHMEEGDLVADRTPIEIEAQHRNLLFSGSERFETRHRRKDGSTIDLEATVSVARLGKDHFFFAFFRDITDRKRAEEALARAATEWTYAMDSIEDAIYLVDLDDRIVRANRPFYQLTGLTPDRAIGRHVAHVIHPHGEETDCAVCRARKERRDAYITMEPDHPVNPTGRPIEVMLRVMRNESGEPVGMLMGMHDLTRVREAEAKLRRLTEHFLLLLDSAGEGIFGIDAQGRCTFVNPAAISMLGYTREELMGREVHPLIHHTRADGRPYPKDQCPMFHAVLEGKATRTNNEVLWCRNGSSFPADYSAHPIVDEGRIIGAVVVFRNVAEARALARKMDYLATHDSLTGLLNRHAFESRVERALAAARAERQTHTLCFIDLDQFKVINDTCGHVAGDELLRQMGALLHAQLSEGDRLGRLGGDEFGVLIERRPLREALEVVRALLDTIQGLRFVWEDKTFAIGASIGVVTVTAETESLAGALSAADTACYVAKDSGRNRIHVHETGDYELAKRRGEMQWVSRIHDALDEGRFLLRYQPIVALEPERRTGDCYEILLSMRDHTGHVVPPGAFLPAAERFNLMPAIDRWVVGSTLSWLAAHPRQLDRLALCTINLSGTTLSDDTFLGTVMEMLRHSRIPPHKICFEITETAAIANLSQAIHFIQKLTGLGCRFALDDFGSGMSSFAYLRNLPVDFLKIDGNFVREIVGDQVDRAMVEAINQVGHVMNIQTIAEHLESEEILEALREIGIDYGQGFGIGAPRILETMVEAAGPDWA